MCRASLAGYPQIAFYGYQLLAVYALLRGVQRARSAERAREAVTACATVAAALALGAGIAAIQLWPTAELVAASDRGAPFSGGEIHYLNERTRLPQLLENAVTPGQRLTSMEGGAGYLGIGTLVFMAVALAQQRRDPLVWCLAVGGVGFFVLSDGYLGVGRELFELYSRLPGVLYFRAPERLLVPAFACWVGLAALGANSCDRGSRQCLRPSRLWP